jgi:hypothetical protein
MKNFYKETEKFVNEVTGGNRHLERTVFWLKKLKPDAGEAMLIAALSHDIERAFRDSAYDKITKSEKGYQSEDHLLYHQTKGAEIMAEFLKKNGAGRELINKVFSLIEKHEVGGDSDQNLIKDADSLSFLENNIDLFLEKHVATSGKEKVRDKFNWTFNRITSEVARELARPYFDEAIRKLNAAK